MQEGPVVFNNIEFMISVFVIIMCRGREVDDSHTICCTFFFSFSQELGDVENWARSIETDMQTIASALEYAYKGDLEGC